MGDKNKVDLLEVIQHYLANEIPSLPLDPSDNQVIRSELFNRKGRYLNGILRFGGYGHGSMLLDVQADTISYERQLNDAELIPYFYLIKIPPTVNRGIIIFQKLGNLGVKEMFYKDFNEYFKNAHQDYVLEIDPLIPNDLVTQYLENRIVKIRLIKYGFPSDIADVPRDGIPQETEGETEFVLKAKKNGSFPSHMVNMLKNNIKDFLGSNDSSVGSILEVKNFQADNVKIEVRIGNSYRTVDLSNTERLSFSEDISGRVKINLNTGHPEFDSIEKLAESFLNDCGTAIWGEHTNV